GDQTEEIPPFPLLDANPPERRVAGVFADFPALPEYHGAQAAVVLRRLRQGDAPGGSAHTRTGVRSARSVRTPPGGGRPAPDAGRRCPLQERSGGRAVRRPPLGRPHPLPLGAVLGGPQGTQYLCWIPSTKEGVGPAFDVADGLMQH